MATGKAHFANLEALEAARLTALVLAISAADAAAKRRLQLAKIAKARSFIDWQRVKLSGAGVVCWLV